MSSSVRVAVRCRPLNAREIARGAKGLVEMHGNQTILRSPDGADGDAAYAKSSSRVPHTFTFDHSYWSAGAKDEPNYASQATLFDDLGRQLLEHSFEGYNTCIFAYGQTGSGKSYSMMGYGADRGLIPLTCSGLFDRITSASSDTLSFHVEVSFIEIYNERVRDLLNPRNKGNLKVREHPSLGPYVEDLSKLAVESFAEMEKLMDEGNKARTVASTQMNETSSRSHSVFTVLLTQRKIDIATKMVGEKVSRISLVDLAGSERANSTGATGQRLKEGANINKSLTTLGKVISALAAQSAAPKGKKKATSAEFVPYRDSVLTWLLKDSLGGNSRTFMIAAISPADYEETLSTLRYADQAKKIQNKAVVNEDANAKLVRELKEELALLRARVAGTSGESVYDSSIPAEQQIVRYQTKSGEIKSVTKAELQEQLEQSEKLMADVNQTWEQKMEKTIIIHKEREQALEELGITIERGNVGIHTPKKMPHLVNLSEDPLASECLLYQIRPGRTTVGNIDTADSLDIRLSGSKVLPLHCFFENTGDGNVELHALPGGTTMVNGLRVNSSKPKQLKSGYRLIVGDQHFFRFNNPEEVRKARGSTPGTSGLSQSMSMEGLEDKAAQLIDDDEDPPKRFDTPEQRPVSPTASAVDWNYARREAVLAKLHGQEVDLDHLDDRELDTLFSDLMKVRSHRRQATGTGSGRPESRASFMDSIDEYDADQTSASAFGDVVREESSSTDETSLGMLSNTTSMSALAELQLRETKEELQREMDTQREEYEVKLKSLAESVIAIETTRAEKAKMEEQLVTMQEQMQQELARQKTEYEHRMAQVASKAKGRKIRRDVNGLDDDEVDLAHSVIKKWRKLQRINMAQFVLAKAVELKKANVVSREMSKGVTYQFCVLDCTAPPISSHEGFSGAVYDLGDTAGEAGKHSDSDLPRIGIKVIDRKNTCIYTWTYHRFEQSLQQMYRILSLLDKPSYSQHFNLEDPFYQSSPPSWTSIGTATIPLGPLSKKIQLLTNVRIYSHYDSQQLGTCCVRFKPLAVAKSDRDFSPSLANPLLEGSQYSFEIQVDSVSGLDGADFSSIHCQIHRSQLIPGNDTVDEVYTSPVADLDSTGTTRMRLRKTLCIAMSEAVFKRMATGYATIEFFAKCKPAYLIKCEKWDATKEEKAPIRPGHMNRADSDLKSNTTGRRAETEMLTEHVNDVKAMLSIQELSSSGAYDSVPLTMSSPLDPGVFNCRQGLQRRIKIVLSHACGKQWQWKTVKDVKIGNVRLLDPRGHVLDSRNTVMVPLPSLAKRSKIDFTANGTTSLTFLAAWDSSAHNSLFLDKLTATGHRVLLEMSWDLDTAECSEAIHFSVDIGLSMQDREARRGTRLFRFFTSEKTSSQAVQLFKVTLKPKDVNKPHELWRLDTSSTFVRGQELLLDWKPRGISLVEDFYDRRRVELDLADVMTTKAILAVIHSTRLIPATLGQLPETRMWQALQLWEKRLGYAKQRVQLTQNPDWHHIEQAVTSPRRIDQNGARFRRMIAQVQHVAKGETVAKRGYLYIMLDDGQDVWMKVWAVFRRPYLTLFRHSDEMEELTNIINISTVRVDHSLELEQVLNRSHAFGVYTGVSALFVAADTFPIMLEWAQLIDPSWRRHE